MALIKCPDCGNDFSDLAPACPKCGRPNKPAAVLKQARKPGCLAIGCVTLIVVAIIATLADQGSRTVTTPTPDASSLSSAAPSTVSIEPQLELVSWNWHTEYGYAIAEGRVKNISSESLQNVVAVVTFSDKNGEFVTSDDAIIDYNPILPGQTSPFKVMATENPAMRKAGIDFKFLMGGTIDWRDRKKK